ncbi:MAG: alpha/beta fold hydrolase [Pseudomonadota bacterium]
MSRFRVVGALLALSVVLGAVFVLETARSGVSISRTEVGETPVTSFIGADADGPAVVIAHGFAGSSQMMQGYALPLARAGYRVFAFDFLGHGRHRLPMSGDVNAIDGTTRLLVDQTRAVMDAVGSGDAKVALLGHSMATDLLVRAAEDRDDVGPIVLLSAFSQVIDATHPAALLLVAGAWEGRLSAYAVEPAQMVSPDALPGETVSDGAVMRRTVIVPWIEHVSILQSAVARKEALLWLDGFYGRTSDVRVWSTGPAIIALLAGLVIALNLLAKRLPARDLAPASLSLKQATLIVVLPMVVAPPLAVALNPGWLPVLVADYLALHLAIYGGLQLALLAVWRVPLGGFSRAAFLYLLIGSAVFGLALDRYAANFWPTGDRLWIIAALAVGSIPFFVADARLGHRASLRFRAVSHGAFLVSLGIAVALDFEGLFFLLMIAPVIVLFYLAFGTMGHAVSARAGPLAPGLALGLVLAWSLGVSFPLFQA